MNVGLGDFLGQIARRARELIESRDGDPVERMIEDCHELLSSRGEATGLTLASGVFQAWQQLDDDGRKQFVTSLDEQLGPDLGVLEDLTQRFANGEHDLIDAIHRASEPPRQELFRRLNSAPGGTVSLIRLREEIRRLELPRALIKRIDQDFVHLFSSWFNKGFLELTEISWNTPAAVLEKLIEYESVHEIQGWSDLRRRLASDRKCYAYFHPSIPNDPLIFVEVALVKGTARAIAPLLDGNILESQEADTAVFYSINNCQRGLAGVSFGNFLIKQVVEHLRRDLPNLKTFVTLSPVPGLRDWAENERPNADTQSPEALETLCLEYLTQFQGERLIDPVARFHLGNGAKLEHINPQADMSEAGHTRSFGVMVNYLYEADDIVKNHEALMTRSVVALSSNLQSKYKSILMK